MLPGVACTTRAVRRSLRSPAVASAVTRERAEQVRKRKSEELAASSVGSLAAAALAGWGDTVGLCVCLFSYLAIQLFRSRATCAL